MLLEHVTCEQFLANLSMLAEQQAQPAGFVGQYLRQQAQRAWEKPMDVNRRDDL